MKIKKVHIKKLAKTETEYWNFQYTVIVVMDLQTNQHENAVT